MLVDHSPAEIIAQALKDAGLVSFPADETDWPMTVSRLVNDPNQALGIYNTTGNLDSRLMQSGETKRHPGWQIQCRAEDYPTGNKKLAEIANHLDTMVRVGVLIAGSNYEIHAVTRSTDLIPLRIPDEREREHFTINGIVAITAI